MIPLFKTHSVGTVFVLTAAMFLCVSPAAADNYQITVDVLGATSIPAPLSYTFDTTTPFSLSNANLTNVSVNFDASCGGKCTVSSVQYNANQTSISYFDSTLNFFTASVCSGFLFGGSCTVNPGKDITTTGTYQAAGGTVTVTDLTTASRVPEPTSYLELAGMALSLAFLGVRRFSPKRTV
jgi:hypothetical protein